MPDYTNAWLVLTQEPYDNPRLQYDGELGAYGALVP
jgi:hypothetical protein